MDSSRPDRSSRNGAPSLTGPGDRPCRRDGVTFAPVRRACRWPARALSPWSLLVAAVWLGRPGSTGPGGFVPSDPPSATIVETPEPSASPSRRRRRPRRRRHRPRPRRRRPPPTPTAAPTIGACAPPTLRPGSPMWEGAAGSRIADVEVTNTGRDACTLEKLGAPSSSMVPAGSSSMAATPATRSVIELVSERTAHDARRGRQLLRPRPGRPRRASRSSCATATGSSPHRPRRPTRPSRRATVRANPAVIGMHPWATLMRGAATQSLVATLLIAAGCLDPRRQCRRRRPWRNSSDRSSSSEWTEPPHRRICSAGSVVGRSVASSCSARTSRPGAALIALTAKLQAAAAAGGQPQLPDRHRPGGRRRQADPVGATDDLGAGRWAAIGSASVAHERRAGDTGAALHRLGIDIDLAPGRRYRSRRHRSCTSEGRTWSISASRRALLADAFASGLQSRGVLRP